MTAFENEEQRGPRVGEFVQPPALNADADERRDALPEQEEFWKPPARFGSVPVEREPLGWDSRRGFRKLFPAVYLPFQVVERVSFGHPELEPNRLFWGDNLHVMRQLPSESIDLIYIDPPFFSGRNYNVIFGDQNELRSFSDIWQGGMPGYLIWLNARLYEMKRLLKKTGSICVHCDWHASHYIKVEMDKIFGHENFQNEIVWFYPFAGRSKATFPRKHDVLLWYSKGTNYKFNTTSRWVRMPITDESVTHNFRYVDENGRRYREDPRTSGKVYRYYLDDGKIPEDVWIDIPSLHFELPERIGYPTQKPIQLMQRLLEAFTDPGDTVADFFVGGGSLIAAAQGARVERKTVPVKTRDGSERTKTEIIYSFSMEHRKWIACDQSRVAVAITADRLTRQVEEQTGKLFSVPDFVVEHWGVYEARRLAEMPAEQFRGFVLKCFGATIEEQQPGVNGMKGAVPVWVGEGNPKKAVTAQDVQDFANAIRKTPRYKQDNLRDGILLAWAFRPDALEAAERLRRLEQTDLNFIRLEQVRIDSPRFREHVASLSTDHADYENFLTFVQPPRVEVGHKRVAARTYVFDVSETVVLNSGAKIINVQWDFDHGKRFSSTPGFSFVRGGKSEPQLTAQYEFPRAGAVRIACRVQDDMGGEGLWSDEIEIS
ncbi:MAG: site-specific DNA-methyltransferase [Puniceicoccales bacterium]|jgi:DNA modification methylase|nr:site-specific DNA-methyltransferase [Puniceicoccales bacterium]